MSEILKTTICPQNLKKTSKNSRKTSIKLPRINKNFYEMSENSKKYIRNMSTNSKENVYKSPKNSQKNVHKSSKHSRKTSTNRPKILKKTSTICPQILKKVHKIGFLPSGKKLPPENFLSSRKSHSSVPYLPGRATYYILILKTLFTRRIQLNVSVVY